MTSLTAHPPFWLRLFFTVPVIGWIAHDLQKNPEDNIWYALLTLVSLWGISTLSFGLPGFYIPAVCAVPLIFVILLAITRG